MYLVTILQSIVYADKHFYSFSVMKQQLDFYVNVPVTNLILYRSRYTVVKVRLQCENMDGGGRHEG